MASVVVNGDTSGSVTLSAPAVAGTVTVTLPATSGTMLTTASSTGISGSAISSGTVAEAYGGTGTNTGYYGFKNRIINGAMMISQRNGTSAVTIDGGASYTLDRYLCQDNTDGSYTVAQSSTAPTGFTNSMLVTITGIDSSLTTTQFGRIVQRIEGFNTADLGWGTANAQTVTLSFWVRSSVTGTFSGTFVNNDGNRVYAFTYTISSANTFEYKTINISGDTSGTWATNNSTGIELNLSIGAGPDRSVTAGSWGTSLAYAATGQTNLFATNGATFYITGVQLEKGSTATSFDYRPYGTELQLCQRYYQLFTCSAVEWIYNEANGATNKFWQLYMCVPMRSAPTATYSSGMTGGAVVGFSGTVSSLALVSASVNRLATRVTMSTATGTANLMYHCDSFDGDTVGLSSEL